MRVLNLIFFIVFYLDLLHDKYAYYFSIHEKVSTTFRLTKDTYKKQITKLYFCYSW